MAFGQGAYPIQDATIEQAGTANSADVTQMTQTNESDVYVDQDGQRNAATVEQRYGQFHDADVLQEGTANAANLVQDNTNTKAELQQEGARNSIDAFQRNTEFTFGFAATAYLDVDQAGTANAVSVTQDGRGQMTGLIAQDGARNYAELDQMTPGGSDVPAEVENYADLNQAGTGNSVSVTQGQQAINSAYVTQNGARNAASVTQGIQ